jgi:hypothetical protein
MCRREARQDAAREPLLSSFLHASILSHDCLERSLAFVLAHRLASPVLKETELFEVFCSVLHARPGVAEAAAADIRAVHERVGTLLGGLHAGASGQAVVLLARALQRAGATSGSQMLLHHGFYGAGPGLHELQPRAAALQGLPRHPGLRGGWRSAIPFHAHQPAASAPLPHAPAPLPSQTHRIAHELWTRGNHMLAVALQSRMSECFNVDIHPGARLGPGLLLDHGTGVVIGETAVIGTGVSLLHGVTLGGGPVGARRGRRCRRGVAGQGSHIQGRCARASSGPVPIAKARTTMVLPLALAAPISRGKLAPFLRCVPARCFPSQAQARRRGTATPRLATTCS